ncbi:hypothetical protein D3C76_1101870 [compost metagenome]
MLAGAGCFNCCIQRQDVGLKCDTLYHRDDIGHFLRRVMNVFHGRGDGMHTIAVRSDNPSRLGKEGVHPTGIFCGAFNG